MIFYNKFPHFGNLNLNYIKLNHSRKHKAHELVKLSWKIQVSKFEDGYMDIL